MGAPRRSGSRGLDPVLGVLPGLRDGDVRRADRGDTGRVRRLRRRRCTAPGTGSASCTALTGLLPSLLPIAYGYLLAHYLQYVLINGQLLLPLLGNPVGSQSWPLHLPYPFNDEYEVATGVMPTSVVWYVQIVVIVLAHVAAVVLAHRHLATSTPALREARRSEWPWLVAMVGYTMLSLWLLAQPLVRAGRAADNRS